MNLDQALEVIWNTCAMAPVPLTAHGQWQGAINTIKKTLQIKDEEIALLVAKSNSEEKPVTE